MKPILRYPGAKWNLASWIINQMPPHQSYLEPFFGSGAVFFNKTPARLETINDLDGDIVNFFRVCREQPDELARAIALTPWAREELNHCQDKINNPIERARRTAVACHMTFGSRQHGKSFRHSTGSTQNGGPDNPKIWDRVPTIVMEVAKRLKTAQIENKPAIELIKGFSGKDVLIYLDPPYVKSTRTLHGEQYRFEMADKDHEELLKSIAASDANIIISGYENSLYNDYLTRWNKKSIQARVERGKSKTETIWYNYPLREQIGIFDLQTKGAAAWD